MGGGHAIGLAAVVQAAKDWAESIDASDPQKAVFNGKYSASIYLLLGFSLELLLKSAFIAHGGSEEELRPQGGIGHDLVRALDAAEGRGFQSDAPNLRELVQLMRKPHLANHFRYGGMDNFRLPADLNQVLVCVEHLAGELQQLLCPDDR